MAKPEQNWLEQEKKSRKPRTQKGLETTMTWSTLTWGLEEFTPHWKRKRYVGNHCLDVWEQRRTTFMPASHVLSNLPWSQQNGTSAKNLCLVSLLSVQIIWLSPELCLNTLKHTLSISSAWISTPYMNSSGPCNNQARRWIARAKIFSIRFCLQL